MKEIIQPALPQNGDQLAALGKEAFPGYPFETIYDPSALRRIISAGEIRLNIILNEAIIATGVLDDSNPPMAEIKRVAVHPDCRRNGYASAITQKLASKARESGLIPWADARADQIGMQTAALSAGLVPISLEPGKHAVYEHNGLGPARETMVHLTDLRLPEETLWQELRPWPAHAKTTLTNHLRKGFSPTRKNHQLARSLLPNAQGVSSKIEQSLTDLRVPYSALSGDLLQLHWQGSKIVIIKPDASGFITSFQEKSLGGLINLAAEIGLQIVTCYEDVSALKNCQILDQAGMQPAMIRPWQKENQNPTWQIGWRTTTNHYDQCLHHLELSSQISDYLQDFLNRLEQNI